MTARANAGVPPLRCASVGMTMIERSASVGMTVIERGASVGMTMIERGASVGMTMVGVMGYRRYDGGSGRKRMDLGLKDKLIVVTGGGAGIGAGISRACLAEGARVVVLGRHSQNVEDFMVEMKGAGVTCDLVEAHLEDTERCKSAIAEIEKKFGDGDGIFGLVNNAGVNDGVGLASGSVERFMESLQKNLVHYYALAHYALPALKRAKGSIVNISSKVALTGQGNTSGYAASKGAQLALTREWAAELLPDGIRVNAVLPAEVMTPLYERWLKTLGDPDAKLREITSKIPLGHRMTTQAEIAAATVFLLSTTQSGHTTGQHLIVDGGYVHLDRALT